MSRHLPPPSQRPGPSRRRALVLVAQLLWLAPALSACGDIKAPGTVQCRADRDCPATEDGTSLTCAFGACIAPGPNRAHLALVVRPLPASGLLAQQVPTLSLEAGPSVAVSLVAPVLVHGRVLHEDAAPFNVPGDIEAVAPGDIPGLTHRFATTSVEGLDNDGNGYALLLLPGRTYSVSFWPDDRSLPTHTFSLTPTSAPDQPLDIMLPSMDAYGEIRGFVRFDPLTPIGGAMVVALDSEGHTLSRATSDAARGYFRVRVPPTLTSARLRVVAPPDGPLFPDYVTDPVDVGVSQAVWVPVETREPFDARIRLVGEDPSLGRERSQGLAETQLTLQLPGGSLRQTVTTDLDGLAVVRTLPGSYEVLIVPPPGSPWRTFRGEVELRPTPSGAEDARVTLAPRIPFAGAVLDPSGAPLVAGTVSAARRTAPPSPGYLTYAAQPVSADIVDGRFSLLLDDGTYDLTVLPEPSTGAAPLAVRGVDPETPLEAPLRLPLPGLAHVTLTDAQGDPVEGATLRLLEPGDGADEPPLVLSTGATDAAGVADLPAPFLP